MPKINIRQLDHLVLTVRNIDASLAFYTDILGMQKVEFGDNRIAVQFGAQKINFHQLGHEFEPKAEQVKAGSADLCFITDTPIDSVYSELNTHGIKVLEGPVERTGAKRKIISIYIRDPDGNLIELSNYV